MAWNQPGNNGQDRDPWGSSKPGGNSEGNGNKGGRDQGPPDLDDIFRKLSKKLVDRDYGGMGDYPLSAEEFAAYDGGPWQEGMELAVLPVFRNTTRMDVANGFRTGGGDYAQLRRTMERLAAACSLT